MIVYTITKRKEIGTVLIRTTTLVLNIIECERIEKVKTKKLNYLTTVILTNEGTDFNINNYVTTYNSASVFYRDGMKDRNYRQQARDFSQKSDLWIRDYFSNEAFTINKIIAMSGYDTNLREFKSKMIQPFWGSLKEDDLLRIVLQNT